MGPCYHLAVASAPVRWWLGYLGTAFCLFAALARDQAELDASGCGLSLVAVLTQPPPT